MNVPAYLERIHYRGDITRTLDTLRALHVAHMFAVPFENLDIHLGRHIGLDLDHLHDKIVTQRRGGFCYELNGLFAALLSHIGFQVELFGAEVVQNGQVNRNDSHLTLIVRLDEDWLADVGFGDGFFEPLRLDEARDQIQLGHSFRLVRDGNTITMLERMGDGSEEGYRFERVPRPFEAFREMCEWTATSPESHFTRKRVTTLPIAGGRVTQSDRRLILTQGSAREEKELTRSEYESTLRERFGIALSTGELDKLYFGAAAQRE